MRGVKRSNEFEDLVRRLTETPLTGEGRPIFPTMRELVCFTAVLGFQYERKRRLKSKTQEIDGRIFERSDHALDLLYLIALAHNKNAELLREDKEDEMIRCFEEYSQGGFEILRGWLNEKPEDPNGDQAILSALAKYEFLDFPVDAEDAVGNIKF